LIALARASFFTKHYVLLLEIEKKSTNHIAGNIR
jgi:hypothetical protein